LVVFAFQRKQERKKERKKDGKRKLMKETNKENKEGRLTAWICNDCIISVLNIVPRALLGAKERLRNVIINAALMYDTASTIS
jgi:hypothetical protein